MKKNIQISLLLLIAATLTFCSTKKEQKDTLKKAHIEFVSKDTTIKNLQGATITLYGHDRLLADAKATIITSQKIDFEKVPFSTELEIPSNPESLIKSKITNIDNVGYYLVISYENNQKNEGDIVIDYDAKFPEININSPKKQLIYLKEL